MGCIAFNKYSLEKLPSGRLGDGGMKKETSVVTASFTSSVARNRLRPAVMVSARSGSSTGGKPSLMRRTFSASMSTPSTSKPRAA